MSETLSKESVLEDPANQTLEDVYQDWTDVLKPANEIGKKGKAITYDLFKSFEDFEVILKEIKHGTINGNTWIFKTGLKPPKKTKILGLIEFLNACRENLVADWSRVRAEIIGTIDSDTNEPKELVNLNLKKFHTEPIIENDDLLDAHDWNKLGKTIQHVGEYFMVRDGNDKKNCTNCQEMNMITDVFSIHLIKMNNNNWKNSTCTCVDWLKYYKCSHTIAGAYRLNLVNFNDVFMDLPISNKSKKGAPQKTAKSLQHQPSDLVSNEELVDEEVVPPSKRVCVRPTTSAMASEINDNAKLKNNL
ncbi:hypothetical protein BpHYR1_032095 [Brachionus plicatilis]|uniref:SWIM-type domain-containing protein n=1 Tax=Brachionus plicatilis TaxID=10195 RepID=A0A3M7T0H6_BRAPC|nr:hypothetical protein BpHYR1_032095 [Brachionus plicatilis]